MHRYKFKLVLYRKNFMDSNKTPILWWIAIDNDKNCLQDLAFYILSITLYSIEYEQVFLTFG
jgi:hypothetical protein